MYKNNSRDSIELKDCSPLPKAFGTATILYESLCGIRYGKGT